MRTFITLYFEGSDSKVSIFQEDKGNITFLKAGSFEVARLEQEYNQSETAVTFEGDVSISALDLENSSISQTHFSNTYIQSLYQLLSGIDLGKAVFLPILTEPTINYQAFEGKDHGAAAKKKKHEKDLHTLDLSDQSTMTILHGGDVGYISMLDTLAKLFNLRAFKMPVVKASDVSLAYYVAKQKRFRANDYSLVFYTGKEYSKLIFLHGDKIKHIGPLLNLGKNNHGSYDVFESKILFEMENGGIPRLDNIVVCGEDVSDGMFDMFIAAFSEVLVTGLEFRDVNIAQLKDIPQSLISSYSVTIAAAVEFVDEQSNLKERTINILPPKLLERAIVFPLAWHGYLIIPLIFFLAFYITISLLGNKSELAKMDKEIATLQTKQRENQDLLNKINDLKKTIGGFSTTQALLDTAARGSGLWSLILSDISAFSNKNGTIWLTSISAKDFEKFELSGVTLNRRSLPLFAKNYPEAFLTLASAEKIVQKPVYKFNINIHNVDSLSILRAKRDTIQSTTKNVGAK